MRTGTLVIALGFALAAITLMLVERFGQVTAYWLLAAGLAAITSASGSTGIEKYAEEFADWRSLSSPQESGFGLSRRILSVRTDTYRL